MNSSIMTATEAFLFPNPGEFNFEIANAEEWNLYKFRLERYLRSPSFKNLDNDSKIDILLATMGKAADKIYLSFRSKLATSTTVEEVLEQFEQYLDPKFNVIALRAKFIRRTQEENEPILYFLRDLFQLAEPCEFMNKEDRIKDQLILGLANSELSMALKNDPEMTLDKAVSKLRAWEEQLMNQDRSNIERWGDDAHSHPFQQDVCQQCQLQGFSRSYPHAQCSCQNKNPNRGHANKLPLQKSFFEDVRKLVPHPESFSEFQECSSTTQSFHHDPLSSLGHRMSPHCSTSPMAPTNLMGPPLKSCLKRKQTEELFEIPQECSSTQSVHLDLSSLCPRGSPHHPILSPMAPTDLIAPLHETNLKFKQVQDQFEQEMGAVKSSAHRRLGPLPQRHEFHSSESQRELPHHGFTGSVSPSHDSFSALSLRMSPHHPTPMAHTDHTSPPRETFLKLKPTQDLFEQEDVLVKSSAHRRLGPVLQHHESSFSESQQELSRHRSTDLLSPSHDSFSSLSHRMSPHQPTPMAPILSYQEEDIFEKEHGAVKSSILRHHQNHDSRSSQRQRELSRHRSTDPMSPSRDAYHESRPSQSQRELSRHRSTDPMSPSRDAYHESRPSQSQRELSRHHSTDPMSPSHYTYHESRHRSTECVSSSRDSWHESRPSQSQRELSRHRSTDDVSSSRDTSLKRRRTQDLSEKARSPNSSSRRNSSSVSSPHSKRRPATETNNETDSQHRQKQIGTESRRYDEVSKSDHSNRREMETDREVLRGRQKEVDNHAKNTKRPSASNRRNKVEPVSDVVRLSRRRKQIASGKNSVGYRCYLAAVPKHKRSHRDIHTPPIELKYNGQAFDHMLQEWRQQLHKWDPPGRHDSSDTLDFPSGEEWRVLSSLDHTDTNRRRHRDVWSSQ